MIDELHEIKEMRKKLGWTQAELARQAVAAFDAIQQSGANSAQHLEDIWTRDVLPKILAAFGTLPPQFAELDRLFGHTSQTIIAGATKAAHSIDTLRDATQEATEAMRALGVMAAQVGDAPSAFGGPPRPGFGGPPLPGFLPPGPSPAPGRRPPPPLQPVLRSAQQGMDFVTQDMPVFVHQGERIVPAAQSLS